MSQTLTIGRLFDIRVGVHVSWLLVYVFMTISIARAIGDVGQGFALGEGALCALALFASVVAHEFAHALVARRFGVHTRAITLFLFGGVATLEREPPTPRAEIAIALAGPAMSALLAGVAFGAFVLTAALATGGLRENLGMFLAYVTTANGVLAVFNLLPAYPMDGGRVLRAAVWHVRGSRATATMAAALAGVVLASTLGTAGVVAIVLQHAWQDGWYVLLGAFLVRQSWVQFREARRLASTDVACEVAA
jgi:Zn-dependent protease